MHDSSVPVTLPSVARPTLLCPAVAAIALLSMPVLAVDLLEPPLIAPRHLASVTRACDTQLATASKLIHVIETALVTRDIFKTWNMLSIAIEEVAGPFDLLARVHPDVAVRDAAERCLQRVGVLNVETYQNRALFERIKSAVPSNPHEAKLKSDLIGAFKDTGITLPPEQQKKAAHILGRLTELGQRFERNLLEDNTQIGFLPEELRGLSPQWLAEQASNRRPDGSYLIPMRAISYGTFMRSAENPEARKRFFIARENRGGEANLAILEELSSLRHELAVLEGFPSYAHYALRRRMASDPGTVQRLLDDVTKGVAPLAQQELQQLRELKARDIGQPIEAIRVERWDLDYYQNKIRQERFAVDAESLRRYFPTSKSIQVVLELAHRLFGVQFRERDAPTWHPDVRYYEVLEDDGALRAGLYFDLFPRDGKRGGGATFPIRNASRLERRTPVCAIMLGINREGLTPQEFGVLLHEFGHALHCVLSETDYAAHGFTNVKLEFVEVPSTMLQQWSKSESVFALMHRVCPDCPRLPPEQSNAIDAAMRYGQGIGETEETLNAQFDLALAQTPQPPLELWKRLASQTPLGFVEGTMYPASFHHIASGMAAGYYAYISSDVLALDMMTPFKGRMLDAHVGMRFRREVLSQGAQQDEMAMVRAFLGREPSRAAFIESFALHQ